MAATGVIIIVIIIVAAVAVYYAVSIPGKSSTTTTTTTPTTTTTTSTPITTTTTTSTSAGNKTLNAEIAQPFGTLDPAAGNDYTQFAANINMYDNLLTQAPDGTVEPNVATQWTISSNDLTYTFNMQSGIHFHSGDLMNASDVVFSMDRELAIGQGFSSLWTPVLSPSGVKALNATAVQFTLNEVYAPFLGSLSLFFVVDQNVVMQHLANVTAGNPMGDWGLGWLTAHDAGSGPYMLQSYSPGGSPELSLTRFTGYWKGWASNSTPFNTANYYYIDSDSTVLSLAETGGLNWAGTFLAVPTYQSLQKMGWTWDTFASPNTFSLVMNTQCGCVFSNLDFRKAVSYAFNYTAIATILPGAVQSKGPVANSYEYHESNVLQYSYNPTEAKAMLQASGINPSTTTITLTYVTGNIPEQEIAALFQTNMENVLGITVNIATQTFQTITQLAASNTTTPQISEIYYDPLYPDTDSYFYPIYASSASGTWESMSWLNNATINSLIAQERASTNSSQRQQIFYELQNDIVSLAPEVFVFNQPYYVTFAPTVKGYTFYDGMSFDYNVFLYTSVSAISANPAVPLFSLPTSDAKPGPAADD
jgi:peptide/nickel transport system substrate-binding protein